MSSRSGSGEAAMMSDLSLNQQVIAEFRANGGRVGGYLEGALVVLVHRRGD